VACIELCRGEESNPVVPQFLAADYFQAIQELAGTALSQFSLVKELDDFRFLLSILALSKGARVHGKFLFNYCEEELLELGAKL
jgi:hypothetical protein